MRIGIKRLTGDPAIVGPAMVLGRSWAHQMQRLLVLGGQDSSQRREKVAFATGEATIRVTVERDLTGEFVGSVWVDAESGCSENAGYLLKTVNGQWYAYYNDGQRERINPPEGKPRPSPDPAVRTKRAVLPAQLRTLQKRAAMFSGLMRMAVQCDHSRGVATVFSNTWLKTHGILSLLDQAPDNEGSSSAVHDQAARNRYWVVEISPDGIYAAPVTWSGKCCDGFSVAKYLPTSAEVAASPSLAAYRSELSLKVAKAMGKRGVVQVLPAASMAAAYVGEPWNLDDGWAFSRSGRAAQNVTQWQSGLHYVTERWKIQFTTSFNGVDYDLSASITKVESGTVMFPATDPLWTPAGDGEWAAIPRIVPTDLTTQDGPVHVFYQGETEFVTRYENGGSVSYGSTTTGSFNNPGDPVPLNRGLRTLGYTVCGAPWDDGGTGTGWEPASPGNSVVTGAHSSVTSGFSNPAASGSGATTSSGYLVTTRTSSFNGTITTTINDPAEVFTIDCCGSPVHTKLTTHEEGVDMTLVEKSVTAISNYSACVLLHREREGIMLLTKTVESGEILTNQYQHDVGRVMADFTRVLTGGPYTPPPCWTDVSGVGTPPNNTVATFGNDTFTAPSSTDSLTTGAYETITGTYVLTLGANSYSGALPQSGGDIRDIFNRAFSNPDPPSALVLPNFDAMHGAMFYAPADMTATQPDNFPPLKDQRNNDVYRFPDDTVTHGGFINDNNPTFSFVGQA